MENSPREAVQFLKDPDVKAVLGPEEQAEWLDKAKKRAIDFKGIARNKQFEQLAASMLWKLMLLSG